MDVTFTKTIKGHTLQFNRLLYPTRYTIKLDEEGSDGRQYEFQKNGNTWNLTSEEGIPDWMVDITSDINATIEENEPKE